MRTIHAFAILGTLLSSLLLAILCTAITADLTIGPTATVALAAGYPTATNPPTPAMPQPTATQPSALPATTATQPTAQPAKCRVSDRFPAAVLQWRAQICQAAAQTGLEANLLAAVIMQESSGNPQAYSHAGAVGLMQVMPRDGLAARIQCPNGPCFASRPTIAELQDPTYNINYGAGMLAGLVQRTGSLRAGLRAYGPAGVGDAYAEKVLRIYAQYTAR